MKEILNKYGELLEKVDMKSYNTYRASSLVDYLFYPKNINSLVKSIEFFNKNKINYKVLGKGSNIVLNSNSFHGVIIKLDNINDVKIKKNIVYVEAGKEIATMAMDTIKNNLKGLEWATG